MVESRKRSPSTIALRSEVIEEEVSLMLPFFHEK
jgi:hypothetical protein